MYSQNGIHGWPLYSKMYPTWESEYRINALTPKKLHSKPSTLNIIIYICIQKEISINPIHVGLYVGFGGINEMHILIINNLSPKYNQKTSHCSEQIYPL